MRNKTATLLLLLLAAAGVARIASTYPVFSQAWDEPVHVACGIEWWARGTTTCDPTHPPLARAVNAAPLYFAGLGPMPGANEIVQGNDILHAGGHYSRNLAMARAGSLIFYVLACWWVYALARRVFSSVVGVVSVLLFSSLPAILHVGSLAYTDMAVVAFLLWFVYRWLLWLDEATPAHAAWLGISAGAAIGSKYSAIPYIALLVAASAAVLLARRLSVPRATRRLTGNWKLALVCVLACTVTLWAVFHFAIAPLSSLGGRHPGADRFLAPGTLASRIAYGALETPVPLSGLVSGIAALASFNRDFEATGEPYYFLGAVRTSGVWYYFPMVLLCTLPVGFLLALPGGFVKVARREMVLCLAPLAVIATNMAANLTYAPRHITPAYPFLSIWAAVFLVTLWQSRRFPLVARPLAVLLAGAHLAASGVAHPDYHAFSNAIQMLLPPVTLADMGKDVARLSRECKHRNIQFLHVAIEGSNDLSRMGLPPFQALEPYRRTEGWIAISEHKLKIHDPRSPPYDGYAWLEACTPAARVGASIRLYHIGPH